MRKQHVRKGRKGKQQRKLIIKLIEARKSDAEMNSAHPYEPSQVWDSTAGIRGEWKHPA